MFPMHFDEKTTEKIIEEIFVLKKVQTYLKPFKQLQFPNILLNDPNLHEVLHFFWFKSVNHDLSTPCSTTCNYFSTRLWA